MLVLTLLALLAQYAEQAGSMQLSHVRPSVCQTIRCSFARRCCGFAVFGRVARRYRSIAAQPAVSSTARNSQRGQYSIVSQGTRLSTDLLLLVQPNSVLAETETRCRISQLDDAVAS